MSPPPPHPPPRRARRRAAEHPTDGTVTLGMVAQRAGVSPSTVSRILNGTATVSEDKRAAVAEAIALLRFVPNPVARGLAGGRTMSVGVVTQAIDSPFYGGALRGIEDQLLRAAYSALFVCGLWNARHEARCIDTLRARRVDGVIVLTGRLSDATLAGYARSMPVVVTGRRQSAPGLMALDFDNFGGARLAVEHLLGLGHRRIAFISGDMRHPDSKERLRGYRSALEAAGVPLHAALILAGAYTEESGRIAVEQLLDRGERFSAVFAANDQMAYGARLALHRRGLQVPGDVSLVGFDDLASSVYSIPPLTTVHHPIYELGQLAATALLQLLAGERPAPTMPQPRLIARESTAPPR